MKKKKVKSPWALAGFPIYIIGFSLLLAGGAPEWLETVSKIMIALGVILLIIAGIDLKKRKKISTSLKNCQTAVFLFEERVTR
ncbi:hypothetical protein COJ23_10045 [Priestia megaterium]|uniref:hypothetical protein n=1 Tax=Priestia megaterium TaxID=1404 RepID=UPI000BF68DF7|nr:hypothetical protein [Priestia megaterium]PFK53997.1 hypothetical protein COJ23_10045 [Priestia megaterium]